MIGEVEDIAVLVQIGDSVSHVAGRCVRSRVFEPEGQIGNVDFYGVHDSVDGASVGAVAHFAFARVVEIYRIKSVLVAEGAGSIRRKGFQLLQNDDGVRIDWISSGTGRRDVVLAAESPAQPIFRDSNPMAGAARRDRRVGVFNS